MLCSHIGHVRENPVEMERVCEHNVYMCSACGFTWECTFGCKPVALGSRLEDELTSILGSN